MGLKGECLGRLGKDVTCRWVGTVLVLLKDGARLVRWVRMYRRRRPRRLGELHLLALDRGLRRRHRHRGGMGGRW